MWQAPERWIYMDGRPHPDELAPHTWQGFSTGEWVGQVLKVRTTHLKKGWIRRNGVPRSDLAEFFFSSRRRHTRFDCAGVQTCALPIFEVINAILARRPETRIGVRTAAPRWLFDLTVKGKVTFSTLECDTGIVQIDALTLDEADSIRRASASPSARGRRPAGEPRVLGEPAAGLVAGDCPPPAG